MGPGVKDPADQTLIMLRLYHRAVSGGSRVPLRRDLQDPPLVTF